MPALRYLVRAFGQHVLLTNPLEKPPHNLIGIQTRIDDSLVHHGGLSSPIVDEHGCEAGIDGLRIDATEAP